MLRRVLAKGGRLRLTLTLTAVSQATSAAGLLVLQWRTDVHPDLYAIGIPIGYATLTAVAIGMLYNIAIGRPGYDRWRRWKLVSAVFNILVAVITAMSLLGEPHLVDERFAAVLLAFTVGGILLSVAGVDAVHAACEGRPGLLAGVSILPNIAFLVALLLPMTLPAFVPAAAWMVAAGAQMVLTAVVMKRQTPALTSVAAPAPSSAMAVDAAFRLQFVGLAVGAVVTAVFPGLYSGAVAGLATGTAAALFLVSRLVTSVVGLGVNAVLVAQLNWSERPPEYGKIATPMVAAGVAALAASLFIADGLARTSVVAAGLTACLVAQTLILREVNFRAKGLTVTVKAVADLGGSTLAILLLLDNPSASGYFGAYCLSQVVTTLVCGWGLRLRLLSTLSTFGVALSIATIAIR